MQPMANNIYDVIVIGAGFCGLSCGAGLKTFGIENFIIVEKGDCVGYFWKSCTYDRLSLHTPLHDLPHDNGLVYSYPKYKSRLQVVSYMKKYCKLHQLSSKIKFNCKVININKITGDPLWKITYLNCLQPNSTTVTVSSKYLVVATSQFRCASIPNNLSQTMNNFNGDIMHSMEYKNASKYENKNMLVIGNGNSGCEICIDAVEHGVNKITMVSRRPRHFIPLTSFEKGPYRLMIIGKYLGVFDIIHSKLFKVTKTHPEFKAQIKTNKYGYMSVDMSKYGIIKPELSHMEETLEGNYQVMDIGFIALLESGRVDIINKGGVKKFERDNKIHMENGEILKDKYDVIVLCTGFKHGLQQLFDKSIFTDYFYDGTEHNKCKFYPRFNVYPKTNGQNQALHDSSLYFAAFDQGITSGLARGLVGWNIARQISKDEQKYDKSMELSTWNYMNTLVMAAIIITIICTIVSIYYIFF